MTSPRAPGTAPNQSCHPAGTGPGGTLAVELCPATFRLDGETFRCHLPITHLHLDSDHECRVYWADEIIGRRHRPYLTSQ